MTMKAIWSLATKTASGLSALGLSNISNVASLVFPARKFPTFREKTDRPLSAISLLKPASLSLCVEAPSQPAIYPIFS